MLELLPLEERSADCAYCCFKLKSLLDDMAATISDLDVKSRAFQEEIQAAMYKAGQDPGGSWFEVVSAIFPGFGRLLDEFTRLLAYVERAYSSTLEVLERLLGGWIILSKKHRGATGGGISVEEFLQNTRQISAGASEASASLDRLAEALTMIVIPELADERFARSAGMCIATLETVSNSFFDTGMMARRLETLASTSGPEGRADPAPPRGGAI